MNFTFSETREPGTYKPALDGDRRTAIVICPQCGSRLHLSPHIVLDNGAVTPSVVCRPPCEFHEFITLDGWLSYIFHSCVTPHVCGFEVDGDSIENTIASFCEDISDSFVLLDLTGCLDSGLL